jgi:hypothetical protein
MHCDGYVRTESRDPPAFILSEAEYPAVPVTKLGVSTSSTELHWLQDTIFSHRWLRRVLSSDM